MKGSIVANNGESWYVVTIPRATALLDAERERVQKDLDVIGRALQGAEQAHTEANTAYITALASIDAAVEAYNACLAEYSYQDCLDTAYAACSDARNDCRDDCFDGPSEDRNACYDACDAVYEACQASARVQCQDQWIAHQAACKATHGPTVAAAQADTAGKLAAVQALAQSVSEWRVRQTGMQRRKTQLDQIADAPITRTTVLAQYDDTLQPGTEVDVVRGPNTAYVISTIKSADPCVEDARVYPSGHLFINSALAPGAETWMPTYRTGEVLERTDDDKLKVRIDGGVMPGTLGTRISRRDIDCTPPQAYFDGDWQTIESAIDAARTDLDAAQATLTQAYEDRQTCLDSWDQTACYDPKQAACEATWGQWLIDCGKLSEACQQAAQEGLQSCLEAALAECVEARRAHEADCYASFAGSIQAAEQAVSDAQSTLTAALNRIQRPADPLEMDLPVAHCSPSTYEIGDRVLIDFPVRSATSENPMAVWQSARVIGWAEDPRFCAFRGIWRKDQAGALSLSDIRPALLFPRDWQEPPEDYEPPDVPSGTLYAIEVNGDVTIVNGGAWKYARWMDYTYDSPLTINSTPKTYIIRGSETPVKGWPWTDAQGAVRYVDVTAVLTSTWSEATRLTSKTAAITVTFLNSRGVEFDPESPLYLPPWSFEIESGERIISAGHNPLVDGLNATHTVAAHNSHSWIDMGVLSIKPNGSAAVLALCEDSAQQILDFVIIDVSERTYVAELFDINAQGSATYSKEYVNGTVWLRDITGRVTLSNPPRQEISYVVSSREGRLGFNESASSTVTAPIWFGFDADGSVYRIDATYVKTYAGTVGGHAVENPATLSGTVTSYPAWQSGTVYSIGDVVYRTAFSNSGQHVARKSGALPRPSSGSDANWAFASYGNTRTQPWTQHQTSEYSYDFSVTLKKITGDTESTIYAHSENRTGERQSTIYHYSFFYPLMYNGVDYDHPYTALSYQETIASSIDGDIQNTSSATQSYSTLPTQYQTFNPWDESDPYGVNFSRYTLYKFSDTVMAASFSPRRLFMAMPWGYRMLHDSSSHDAKGLILPASGIHAWDEEGESRYLASAIDAPAGLGIKTVVEGSDAGDYFAGGDLDNRLALIGYVTAEERTAPPEDPTPDPAP